MVRRVLVLFLLFITHYSLFTDSVSAQTVPEQVASEIDQFLSNPSVDGYLLWQYSGPPSNYLENDQFSFFEGSPICTVLNAKAQQYPGKLIGVNIHSLSNYDTGVIDYNLAYLSSSCGTSLIRIWGTPDRGDPAKVLQVAQRYNIRVIVVLADYSNTSDPILPDIRSDPTGWYDHGYVGTGYRQYAINMASRIGSHPALYAIELANEPHCGGHAGCVSPYTNWARDVSGAIKGVSGSIRVGIGQKANENTTRGDSPGVGSPPDFTQSNNSSTLDVASGHYYNDSASTKALVLQALSQAASLGKRFYVGESGFVTGETPSGTASQSTSYRDPRQEGFPDPLEFSPVTVGAPCDNVVPNLLSPLTLEFHPLRPYPASPCDPLIPRSNPEALVTSDKYYMSFACGKSLNVSGNFDDFNLYQDPATYPTFPPSADTAQPGQLYRCSPTSAIECRCELTTPPSQKVCAIMRSSFDVSVDLSSAQLPIIGNTQDPIDDATKVNQYLTWYLNGTLQQSERFTGDPFDQAFTDRLVNFSGPLKKLLPFDLRQQIHVDVANDPEGALREYHNYMVGCLRTPADLRYYTDVTKAWQQFWFQVGFTLGQIFMDQLNLDSSLAQLWDFIQNRNDLVPDLVSAGRAGDWNTVQSIWSAYGSLLTDVFRVINANPQLGASIWNLIDKVTMEHAVVCDNSIFQWIADAFGTGTIARLNELPPRYPDGHLPPNPRSSRYDGSFAAYWRDYSAWAGSIYLNFPFVSGVYDVPWLPNKWAEIFAQVPFSNLEDTTGEVTFSLLPPQQPGLTSPFDSGLVNYLEGGFVYPTPIISGAPAPPNAIRLTVRNTTDNRLYFPHLRNANYLSNLLQKIGSPQVGPDYPDPLPNRYYLARPIQKIEEHQGLRYDDDTFTKADTITPICGRTGCVPNRDPRDNSSVLPARPLFTEFDQRCDLAESRSNPGDTLYGQSDAISANIAYTTFLTFTSQVLTTAKIDTGNICGNVSTFTPITPTPGEYYCQWNFSASPQHCENSSIYSDDCGDGYEPNPIRPCTGFSRTQCERTHRCVLDSDPLTLVPTIPVADCNGSQDFNCSDPNYSSHCPGGPWPTPGGSCREYATCVCQNNAIPQDDQYVCQGTNPPKVLPTESRLAIFTKTPLVERIYESLVGSANSVIRRFIPGPNTPPNCDADCLAQAFYYYIPHGGSTLPGSTSVTYGGGAVSTSGYGNVPDNSRVSAGAGTGPAAIYFPRIGSLYDYFLGGAGDVDPNLQKLLRPYGFLSAAIPVSSTTAPPGICPVPTVGYCSVNDPVTQLTNIFGTQATNAAQICNRESGGNASALNSTCPDYSVGLFQINLICAPNTGFLSDPAASFTSPAGTLGQILARARSRIPAGSTRRVRSCYDAWWHPNDVGQTSKWACASPSAACSANYLTAYLADSQLRDDCVTWFSQPQNNVAYAYSLSSAGTNWSPWSTAAVCGIN